MVLFQRPRKVNKFLRQRKMTRESQFAALAAEAIEDRALAVAVVLGAITLLLALRTSIDCADAVAAIRQAVDREKR